MSDVGHAPDGRFGRVELVAAERRFAVDGVPVALGSRAFDLLAALVARRDRVVGKDELIEVVWPGLVVEDNNLQVQISALRKVLGAAAIATVPGRGYQFTVAAAAPIGTSWAAAWPAAETQSPATPTVASARASASAATSGRRCRLLVADDNKVNRLLLCRSLALLEHEVASVENGRQALAALRSERFDLLLLDLQMPELDGFAVLEERSTDAALQAVPVIVTSSLEGAAAVARCIELGADDFLHKPVNPMLLKARVEASLERKQLRDRERGLLARLLPDLPAHLRQGGAAADGQRVTATLMAARLGGIEPLAAAETPAATLDMLGSWSTLMVDAVEAHGGWVHQFAGDGVAAAFGTGAPADAALQALEAALEMRALGDQFNGERGAAGRPAPTLAIGLATGTVTIGYGGTQHRAALVCVGAAAQRAARLEALAGAAGETLIDEATRAALAGRADTEPRAGADILSPADIGPVHALRVRRFRSEP